MTQSVPARHDAVVRSGSRQGDPVVVVGAGPYGLSVTAHLRAAGVPVRVFGEVMGSWRHAMATGMFLKSTPQATDLSAPVPGGRLADFCQDVGEPELTELTPIPCTTFVRYGMWFAHRYVGDVENIRVRGVARSRTGFTVCLEDGQEIRASAVIVATGLAAFAHIPPSLLHLAPRGPGPDAALSHTSQHTDLSRYASQRVAVLGGGQSALESAALLHEAGASVHVLVRGARIRWGERPVIHRPLAQRIARPASPLGTGWALAALCRAPGATRLLPARARLLVHRRALGPSGGWWLRDRVEGTVPVHSARRITDASLQGHQVQLQLAGDGQGPDHLTVDHLLSATGYRLDIGALTFLSPTIRRSLDRVPGSQAPRLTAEFESSIPGLYFTGSLAAPVFGPMLRFVAGTGFTASRITRHLARHGQRHP
jgi:thioredoxin reductase